MSVVVPTRDRPARLRNALHSIADQDYPGDLECLVVFDRSEPGEVGWDARPGRSIRLLRNARTPGPAGARNSGALAAAGELLAFCDDDDTWHLDKLRTQIAAARSKAVAAITCGIVVRYASRAVPRIPTADRIVLRDLVRSRSTDAHTSTLVVRTDDFRGRIGMFDETMPAGYGEDYEWLLRAAAWRPLLAVQRALVLVEWHETSWFEGRWDTIIEAIERLLETHPEIREDRAGLARLYGRLAFAHAAAGRRRDAWRWIGRTVRLDVRERRPYLAAAVALGVKPTLLVDVAHRAGRGI